MRAVWVGVGGTFLVAMVAVFVYLAVRVVAEARRRRDGIRPDTTSPSFPNHQAMARWIERQVQDDMVRPMLTREDQAEAVRLLRRFYGEENAGSLPQLPSQSKE